MGLPNRNIAEQKKSKNLTTKAYEYIHHMIIYNEVKPGEFLSENTLAQALDMSRTPVREALKILANESLVEIHNGIGIYVRNITLREVHELFEVRNALECAAVNSFLRNISEDEITNMENSWLNLRQRIQNGEEVNYEEIALNDHRLHNEILDLSDNAIMKDIIHGIRQRIQRCQSLSVRAYIDQNVTIEQHLTLLKLIRSRNENEVKRALAEHIKFAENNLLQFSGLNF